MGIFTFESLHFSQCKVPLTLCILQSTLKGSSVLSCVETEPFMHIITEKHLSRAAARYPDAAREIGAWRKIAKAARWRNFVEVRQVFKDADAVKQYVVFNIRQNRYRLVTIIHYSREKDARLTEGHVYIRSFLTHKDYDDPANWDRGVPR
jgi:mRNA interferase HigB